MIQSLYHLGITLSEKEEFRDYFATYANPFPGRAEEALVVYFDIREDEVGELDVAAFKPILLDKYLYRPLKGARGAPVVATMPFYPENDLSNEKKREKHLDSLDKLMSRLERSIPPGPSPYFSADFARERGMEKIRTQLAEYAGDRDRRYLLTFQVNGRWLGDIPELVEKLDDEAYEKYYEKSSAEHQTCAVTHEQGVTVWGRVDTLGFTVEKLAFSRGGFDPKFSYQMFPVSGKAVRLLEGARSYALEKLSASFYNLKYLIVPRMIEADPVHLRIVIKSLSQRDGTHELDAQLKPILSADRKLDRIARDGELSRAGMLYDILFYHQNQAQFAIDLQLQDISPSRLSRIKQVQEWINYRFERLNRIKTSKGEVIDFNLRFGVIKDFFSTGTGNDIQYDPYFFKLLEAVFYGEHLREHSIITAFMQRIRQDFKQRHESNRYDLRTRQAMAIWQFFNQLGLFPGTNPDSMDEKSRIATNADEFLQQNAAYFRPDKPLLRGAFLQGCLASMLLYAQYSHLKNTPFTNQLNNLNLDAKDLRALQPKLLNKITQYQNRNTDKYRPGFVAVNELATQITPLLMQSGTESRDEISFAFVSGLVMGRQFGIAKAGDEEE